MLARLHAALDRALAESARARALCERLADRRLDVVPAGMPMQIQVRSDGVQVRVAIVHARVDAAADAATLDTPADATLTGGIVALLSWPRSDSRVLFQNRSLTLQGSGEVAQQFAELAQLLRPDIEHEISRLTGPVPAHLLARGARSAVGHLRRLFNTQLRQGAEYLAHERRDLVSVPEAEHQFRQVEALRGAVDQTEARLAALAERLR
jgi:ubiquinone biosynthesis protein UbiJ